MIGKIVDSKSGTFAVVLCSIIVGIAVGSAVPQLSYKIWTIGLVAAVGMSWYCWKKPKQRFAFLVAAGLILGLFRVSFADFLYQREASVFTAEQQITLRGTVVAFPSVRDAQATYLIDTEESLQKNNWQSIQGRVLLHTNRYPEFQYGDRLVFSCVPKFSEYDRSARLVQKAVASCDTSDGVEKISARNADPVMQFLFEGRAKFLARLHASIAEPQAGLLAGLLVGERSASEDLQINFRRTGTAHMVAISGWNVSLVTIALFEMLVATCLNRKRAFWATLLLLIGFVGVVGAGASVVRAAIMGGLVLLGNYTGRAGTALRLVLVAATIMLIGNPWLLRYDLGFDLSFAATIGLLLLAPSLEHHLRFVPERFRLRALLSETLAATLATLPLAIPTFHTISFIAPLANILVLSLVPLTTFVGVVSVLCSAVPIVGPFLLTLAWVFASAIIGFVEYFGTLPMASASVFGFDFSFALLSVISIGLIALLLRTHHERDPVEVV